MAMQSLEKAARALVAPGKGILAADESTGTIGKRLRSVGIEPDEETRRRYRELLFTAPEIQQHISGVIMHDETIRQAARDGTAFPELLAARGISPGIKVDTGAKPLPGSGGESITEGLDGLRERLADYRELGARFAKWRAVIAIDVGRGHPSRYCVLANAHALGRYAALCQEAGVVPIVEPEVLMDGDHPIERCEEVTGGVLRAVFRELAEQRVRLEGIVLKPNMVLPGNRCRRQATVEEVAKRTVALLRRVVPAAVPGIAFLSGGQSDELASAHLNAINALGQAPWELTFSYARALQGVALRIWAGDEANVIAAQAGLAHRASCNAAARCGRYSRELERTPLAA